jgi:GntR family transcriptional regulator, transcriptional repressor for pyruvate dehydrogenase complex
VIEPGIAALAAEHGSEEDMRALEALLEEEREKGPEDEARHLEIDVELHGRLVRMTDNPFLVRIMESIGRLARSSREFTNSLPRMREMAQADHERIVAAVRARDRDAAHDAMREHIEHVARTLAEESLAAEESVARIPGPDGPASEPESG